MNENSKKIENFVLEGAKHVSEVLNTLGLSGKFTEEGLKEAEKWIDNNFPPNKDIPSHLLVPFGIHLGETIIRNIPGTEWVFGSENFAGVFIKQIVTYSGEQHKSRLFPFVRIERFWTHDRTDGISAFFRMSRMSQQYDLTNPEVFKKFKELGDGWYETPEGDRMRVIIIEKNKFRN